MTSSGIARRTFLTGSLGAGLSAGLRGRVAPSPASVETGPGEAAEPTPGERAAMAASARAFMTTCAVPGFSVAVGHSGRIIYQDAFGVADRDKNEPLTPMHLFRIA